MPDRDSDALILVVDDDDAGRYVKRRTLERAGYEVVEAGTGGEGLRLVAERRPALVMLDVQLPDVSGLDVCRVIKRDFAGLMVLQTSASFVTSADRVRGLDGGADNYLTQPVEPAELLAAVRALLRVHEAEEELQRVNASLRASEARYRLILESATDYAIITIDLGGVITTWNAGAQVIMGWEEAEILGRPAHVFFTPEDRTALVPEAEMRGALERGRAEDDRWHMRADGSRFYASGQMMAMRDGAGEVRGYLKMLRDRTEQRQADEERRRAEAALKRLNETLEERVAQEVVKRVKAEEQLRQSQKMEAVGQLTGGIAHDFNNLLTAIVGGLDIIRVRATDDRLKRLAENAFKAAERGAKLTAQLLTFSRIQRIAVAPLAVNALIEGMSDLLARSLGAAVAVRLRLDPAAGQALTDGNQLELAILNLAINARDATPEGGSVTIATARVRSGGEGDLSPGEYVAVEVSDTGGGMSEEVRARAFEPFFTTKPLGQGTGLGLAQVYGTARQSGGVVRIESQPGRGTTVRILLPWAPSADESGEEAAALDGVPNGSPQERLVAATIVVVDDDDDVRAFLADTLDGLGYSVAAAANGEAGLRLIEAAAPDLLLLDFAMPGMNGAEVARAARSRWPDLPIVFVTGYADTASLEEALGPGAPMLRKPFRVAELAAAVEGNLQGGGRRAAAG